MNQIDEVQFWKSEYESMKKAYTFEKLKNEELFVELKKTKQACDNLEDAMRMVNKLIQK